MANEKEEKKQAITPSQYFDILTDAKQNISNEKLKISYATYKELGMKYKRSGQVEARNKLIYLAEVMKMEEKLIEMGITTFIYKDTIEDYITKVADKTVKIVELSRYMREIPDEIVETIEKTKDIFDELYVVFTDYTGKEERKVEKERRDKDPILFGVFKNTTVVADRFYFLGDWVDEYCDLTLDKLIDQYTEKKGYSPAMDIDTPQTVDELIALLKTYTIDDKKPKVTPNMNGQVLDGEIPSYKRDPNVEKKVGFFGKIRSIFK